MTKRVIDHLFPESMEPRREEIENAAGHAGVGYGALHAFALGVEHAERKPGLLQLAGRMADAARQLVGGPSITVGVYAPASIYDVGVRAQVLREAVDAYDAAIIEFSRRKDSP